MIPRPLFADVRVIMSRLALALALLFPLIIGFMILGVLVLLLAL